MADAVMPSDARAPLVITNALRRQWTVDPVKWVRDVIRPPARARCPGGISKQQLDVLNGYRQLVCARLRRHAVEEGTPGVEPLSPLEKELCAKFGISIQAGKGPGKDAVGSWMVLHFLDCMVAPHIKVMATAPTEEQLKNNLWPELYKWINYSPYLKETYTHTAEKVFHNDWRGKGVFASWKTCQKSADPEDQAATMAGKHEDYMLLYVTEASAVPDAVFRPLESTMTGLCNLAFVIFNPTRATGYAIGTQTTDRKYWMAYHWNAEESEIVDTMHVERYAEKYGRTSNMYRINILGLPPHSDFDTLIPYQWVLDAVEAELEPDDDDLCVGGLDVAGGGSAQSVLIAGRGGCAQYVHSTSLMKKREIADWALDYWHQYDMESLAVDVNGLGSGVAEILQEYGCDIRWVNVSCSAERIPHLVQRLRDELWWDLRQAFELHQLSMMNHEELIGELTTIKSEPSSGVNGLLKVESKRQMRTRGLKSPDHADALCLWWHATLKRGRKTRASLRQQRRGRLHRPETNWLTV